MPKRYSQSELDSLFEQANKKWEEGKLTAAFRLFLAAAKAGDPSCQINLGNFYCDGIGVAPNRTQALYWYRRAYRRGHACTAANIGIVFRDEHNLKQALRWFARAVDLGDGDANVEIAKIYLHANNGREKAIRYLKQALRAKKSGITETSREDAQRLLNQLDAFRAGQTVHR